MLSQAKIDLAVLYKLHQYAEEEGGAISPEEVMRLFSYPVSLRRVEVALEELESKGEIVREYHPHYSEVGLWQISRAGIGVVDRAVRAPGSFIGRLHSNGDMWLQSDEAEAAVLKKLVRSETPPEAPAGEVAPVVSDRAIHIHNNVSPTNNVNLRQSDPSAERSAVRASWFSGWGHG